MFILKVLGGAALEGPDGPIGGRPAQKRRLALLALLAMSRTGRLPREKLIACLWPEKGEDGARHLLSDAVYVINRALGADTLAGAGDELRLNPDRLVCDARHFEGLAATDPEAASALYAGPFMDGFFLDGSDEFEGWVRRERERLAGILLATLERVATARDAAGDYRGALDAWRRLAAEDPFNTRVAVQLARALDRSGDPAGALQSAHAHAAFLKNELGLHPTAELRELLASLQARPAEAPTTAPPGDPPALSLVSAAPLVADPPPIVAPRPLVSPGAQAPPHPRHRRWVLATAAAVTVAVLWWAPAWRPADSAAPLRSIAVMPFDHMGGDPSGRYFGEGIADELTTRLGRETALRVAARTSAFALRERQMDAREIGRALGVDALLEGSVRQEDRLARIAVRLVSTRDGYQVWAGSWERTTDEMPLLQEEIASSVLQVLDGKPPARAGRDDRSLAAAVPAEAYQLYLQGRYLWHQRTNESLTRAAEAFERATALAPEYAQAHSGLADAFAVLGFYDYLPPSQAFPRARAAAQRALELDPDLAQAHASLGYVALYYDWNWPEAEAAFGRAIALNPSYSVGHQWFGNYLTARGRFDEAVAAMRRAQDVDPLSLVASAALGWVHFYRRDHDAAVEQCRRTLALNPRFELAHLWAGWADEAAGRYPEAIAHLSAAAELSSNGAVALASLGRAQALSGNQPAARATLARLHELHRAYLPAYELAKLHLALGERDTAIAWLRRAKADRSHSIAFLSVDPQLDALRADPRFLQLEAETTR